MKNFISRILLALPLVLCASCGSDFSQNSEMIALLSAVAHKTAVPDNSFSPEAKEKFYDSIIASGSKEFNLGELQTAMGRNFLQLGKEEKAIELLTQVLDKTPIYDVNERQSLLKDLALSYMRLGERVNCLNNHSSESCIFPIQGRGVHADQNGSAKAIELFETVLKKDPHDLESKWLLNIAYMTVNGYPGKVPKEYLIPNLNSENEGQVIPFVDLAVSTGLDKKDMAGGSIVEDFNNDGYLDVITSSWSLDEGMHYFRNTGNGAFEEVSEASGLARLTGGLHMMQTDYNNDGWKDIFVLRGGWKGTYGEEPNSLLKNNRDGTFTDVTKEAGLLSFHPTQTATWTDFNNDGWLDVFIGNESNPEGTKKHPCELYMNNKNGSFSNVAASAGCNIIAFVKGVTSGDYNNDGLQDIFLSTLGGKKILLKNEGSVNGKLLFKDVSKEAGLEANKTATFPTWFWDYDNDGWLDILICGYEFRKSLAWYTAEEALDAGRGVTGKVILFRNKRDGTFEDISEKAGLNKIAFAMGSNFGDIDNDGWLDMYLGTGNPQYQSLIPNKMFKNVNGERFIDVTSAARVGNLQKGHGVSFADIDSDGDQDIFINMGGAYVGDAYQNSLYMNPGQNKNHWINISLEGIKSNKAAIGAKIKISFTEQGVKRSVYRDVNSGGSFGSNPLLQHIGIGRATIVEQIEIKWPASKTVQVFQNIEADQHIVIKENSGSLVKVRHHQVDFFKANKGQANSSHHSAH